MNSDHRNPILYELQGAILSEWAEIQFVLSVIFARFSRLDGNRSTAIWYTISTDRGRLEVLVAVARSIFRQDPNSPRPLFKQLLAFRQRVERAAKKRNTLAHSITKYVPSGLAVLTTPGRRPPENSAVPVPTESVFSQKALEQALRQLEILKGDLMAFAGRVDAAFASP
ncbi:MAG: hypothetical protein HY521_02575 [Proteobacteria bacterium]|nr:hypothetical protein [Pseudomonadota bacterium]